MKIKKPWKKDLKLKRMFVVNEHIDTNNNIYIGGPGDNDDKMLGILSLNISIRTQVTFSCLKSTIETLEKVKYLQS